MFSIIEKQRTQIAILWIGQVILMGVLAMSMPYWPLYIKTLGQFSEQEVRFWSAAIYIAPFISSILISPWWGKLGDRYGYKPMVIRACLGLLITQGLILCFQQVSLILAIRFLQGGLAGFIVAAQAWALAVGGSSMRGRILGQLQSATAVGNLIGPLMGGLIATYLGYSSIFSCSTVICALITLVFWICLKNPTKLNQTTPSQAVSHTKKWNSHIKPRSLILSILMVMGMVQIAKIAIMPVFSLFVLDQLHGNEIMVGILYAAVGLMIWLTASHWGNFFDKVLKQKRQVYSVIILLSVICAFLQFFHAYTQTAWTIFLLRLCWGICLGALLPLLLQLLISNTNENAQGMWIGMGNSATKFGSLIGISLGVLIEAYLGYSASFLMSAFCYLAAAFIFLVCFFHE